jgi:protein ImuB
VHALAAQDDHRPERAWKRVALPDAARGPKARAARDDVASARDPRPTWLLPHPVPLRGRVCRVLAGPERLESGWWDDAGVRRDYYVVDTGDGQRAWVYRPAGEAEGGFMLQGWFA